MTLADPYGTTDVRIIAALEQRIAALEKQVRTVTGAPVTQASGPLFLPNSSEPATPAAGVKVYAAGGQMRVIESDGTVRVFPLDFSSVPTPEVELSDAPGAYDSVWAQDLAASVSSMYQSYLVLLALSQPEEP